MRADPRLSRHPGVTRRPQQGLGAGPVAPELRVLVATPFFTPSTGGIETHIRETTQRFPQLSISPRVLTADASRKLPSREVIDGVPVRRVFAWPRGRDYQFAPGAVPAIWQEKPDLVHLQGIGTAFAPTVMADTLAARIPLVVTFHTGGHPSALRGRYRRRIHQILGPLLRRASQLVAVCEYEIDMFSDLLGIPAQRFNLIRNGADMPMADGGSRDLYPGAEPLIVSVGRLETFKGHHRIIKAMPAILRQDPRARLIIVGRGPYLEGLQELTAELQLDEVVEFVSFDGGQRQQMANLVDRADALVLLSEYEAHPVAVMEALSVSTPVLAADTSGFKELERDGLISTVALEASPEEIAAGLKAAIAQGTKPFELSTWDDCASEIAVMYRQVLGQVTSDV